MADTSVYDIILPAGFESDEFLTADVLVEVTLAGPAGPKGDSALPIVNTYTLTAASNWTQAHTFPYPPNVRLIDASNVDVGAEIHYPDPTHVNLSFPSPFTGTAVLS